MLEKGIARFLGQVHDRPLRRIAEIENLAAVGAAGITLTAAPRGVDYQAAMGAKLTTAPTSGRVYTAAQVTE